MSMVQEFREFAMKGNGPQVIAVASGRSKM